MKTIFTVLCGLAMATGVKAQTPLLNSYPAARATIYIDFDGHLHYYKGTESLTADTPRWSSGSRMHHT